MNSIEQEVNKLTVSLNYKLPSYFRLGYGARVSVLGLRTRQIPFYDHTIPKETQPAFVLKKSIKTIDEVVEPLERKRYVPLDMIFKHLPEIGREFHLTGNSLQALSKLYDYNLPEDDILIKRYEKIVEIRKGRSQRDASTQERREIINELAKLYEETKDALVAKLVSTNCMPIIKIIVGKIYKNKRLDKVGIDYDDLINVCVEQIYGLLQRYEPHTSFTTFLERRMGYAIIDYFRDLDPLTRTQREHINKLKKVEEKFASKGIHQQRLEKLAEAADLSIEKVTEALVIQQRQIKIVMLDAPAASRDKKSNLKLHEVIADENSKTDGGEFENIWVKIEEGIHSLDKRHRYVVERRLLEETEKKIGDDLGITESRVSQLYKEAVEILRKRFLKKHSLSPV